MKYKTILAAGLLFITLTASPLLAMDVLFQAEMGNGEKVAVFIDTGICYYYSNGEAEEVYMDGDAVVCGDEQFSIRYHDFNEKEVTCSVYFDGERVDTYKCDNQTIGYNAIEAILHYYIGEELAVDEK
ncbi:MAG: hypothetical protein GF307_01540 [candidate division Zixibacteria bacterium]|nr:hypothetical protein [candidate division Zixibacteria bacterium]